MIDVRSPTTGESPRCAVGSPMSSAPGPAYRIDTPRTSLRCFTPSDHTQLSRAIEESLVHLRPWLAWAAFEPIPVERRIEWLRTQRGQFDLDGDYGFGVFGKAS